MLIDRETQFSDAQPITSTGATPSTNVLDLGANRDLGSGVTLFLALLCQVTTAFTSGGAATLQVQWQTSPDTSGWTTIAQSEPVPVASLIAGYRFLPGPPLGPTARYLRLNYLVGTAAMTAGKMTASFVPALDVQRAYSRGYSA